MSERIRLGIVGLGFGERIHLPAFQKNPRCEVVAVCSKNGNGAREAARRHGIARSFDRWDELVKDKAIDAVAVAVPPFLQPAIALAALEHGKAVFCEKPLALSLNDAHRMAQKAREMGLPNMIDFEFPEIPCWQKARQLLREGFLGDLRHVSVSWNREIYVHEKKVSSWKVSSEEGGGVLNTFASHLFYYLEWLLGRIHKISARLYRYKGALGSGDTLASLWLVLDSGVPVIVTVSNHALLGNGHRLEFYGEKGSLVLDNPTSDYIRGFRLLLGDRSGRGYQVEDQGEWPEDEAADGRLAAVSRITDRFLTWVLEKKAQRPDFQEGLRTQVLLDLARRSNQEKGLLLEGALPCE